MVKRKPKQDHHTYLFSINTKHGNTQYERLLLATKVKKKCSHDFEFISQFRLCFRNSENNCGNCNIRPQNCMILILILQSLHLQFWVSLKIAQHFFEIVRYKLKMYVTHLPFYFVLFCGRNKPPYKTPNNAINIIYYLFKNHQKWELCECFFFSLITFHFQN